MPQRVACLLAGAKALAVARAALLGIEAKEAGALVGGAAALFAAALFLLLPAYLLLCAATLFLLIQTAGIHPVIAVCGLALLHVAAIVALAAAACKLLSRPMFRATAEEFEKDKTWLRSIRTSQKTN